LETRFIADEFAWGHSLSSSSSLSSSYYYYYFFVVLEIEPKAMNATQELYHLSYYPTLYEAIAD
jgi:hypothetical protein